MSIPLFVLTIGLALPLSFWIVVTWMKLRGEEVWQPPKGMLLGGYTSAMLVVFGLAWLEYFGQEKKHALLGVAGFYGLGFSALAWMGWRRKVIDCREQERRLQELQQESTR